MGDDQFFSRLFNYFRFDLTHLSKETIEIYFGLIKDKIRFNISSEPDLSSEIFHWKRYYHQYALENPGKAVFHRETTTKKSILISLEKLKVQFDDLLYCLDVGCGPTSQFYTNDFLKREDVRIINVDPLAEVYKNLHKKYCNKYDIEYITGYGERLSQIFPKDFFHLIYSQNAIDHSQNPQEFIINMFNVLKPGGFLVLHGFIKEGSAAHWFGLHKWDIEVENNDLLLTNKKRTIHKKNLTKELDLSLIWKNVDGFGIGNKYTMVYKKNKANTL